MRTSSKTAAVIAASIAMTASSAEAQLWSALAGKARPHMIVGFDTSVTMGIASDCSGCHRDNPGITTRLDEAKNEIYRTLPMFADYFYYGGFQYRGCGSAHIAGSPILPDRTNPPASLAAVRSMINGASACGSSEDSLPGGSATNTLTPGGANDSTVLQALLGGALPGLSLPPQPSTFPLTPVCVSGPRAGGTIDLRVLLQSELGGLSWPRWNVAITGAEVNNELCSPLRGALANVTTALEQCLGSPAAAQTFWDLQLTCVPGTIANAACTSSPLVGTCVCDQTLPGCTSGGGATPLCSFPLQYKARQQVGVCASYADNTFGNYFRADADNIANRTVFNPVPCRENVSLFFTDGYVGNSSQVPLEAAVALNRYYASPATLQSNMFVFHISNYFTSEANAMATALGNPLYDAQNQQQMVSSFARIVNRVYRGRYVGANTTADRFGTRLAVHSFEVPSGPTAAGETYLGRPSRVAVYPIDPATGTPGTTPLYATDWTSKVAASRTICSAAPTGGCNLAASPCAGKSEADLFGALAPANSQFGNGVARRQSLAPLPSEPGRNRTWGYMLGGSATQPLIVDAPRDVPSGPSAATYTGFASAVGARPRMIYVMSNGFLHGIHAGVRTTSPASLGAFGTQRAYDYDDGPATAAGTELFRFFPRLWLNNTPAPSNLCLNDVVAQSLINGQLQARDLQVGPGNFRTILAAAQGLAGRGLALLDVTDPNNPRLIREWLLPVNERASSEPVLVQWPSPPATPRGALVTTSGLGAGPHMLRAFNAWTGVQISAIAVPAGGPLATEPACVDATGRGAITHCYVLSRVGELFRVPVGPTGIFGGPANITPAGVSGAGRVFLTRPVVFFGNDGAVNVAFGSGLSTDFTAGSDSTQNRFFKVVDAFNRSQTALGQSTLTNVCSYGGTLQNGIIELGNARVVSPPVISKGVIAFTTYTPGSSGCAPGNAALYAIDFARCNDAYDPTGNAAPAAHPLSAPGVPGSPLILRGPESIITQTSVLASGSMASNASLRTRGGDRNTLRRLYWRPQVQAR